MFFDDHDVDGDHDHEEDIDFSKMEGGEDIEGIEMFTLRSVGIDIGSSTSHLVFSQLTLRRQGASLSGRFKVTDRKVLFRSTIMLTPYLSGTLIDVEKVKQFIENAYRAARLQPEDIDTGAVIITGGHGNETGRMIAIHEGEPINGPAMTAIFKAIIADNRAGGWRKLKAAR